MVQFRKRIRLELILPPIYPEKTNSCVILEGIKEEGTLLTKFYGSLRINNAINRISTEDLKYRIDILKRISPSLDSIQLINSLDKALKINNSYSVNW